MSLPSVSFVHESRFRESEALSYCLLIWKNFCHLYRSFFINGDRFSDWLALASDYDPDGLHLFVGQTRRKFSNRSKRWWRKPKTTSDTSEEMNESATKATKIKQRDRWRKKTARQIKEYRFGFIFHFWDFYLLYFFVFRIFLHNTFCVCFNYVHRKRKYYFKTVDSYIYCFHWYALHIFVFLCCCYKWYNN